MGTSMTAEQNQKNARQRLRLIIRIFKWIGLIVLVLLIILGLIFEAPWKVITLFLIILTACTILPKPARKYFWLSVGTVVIALIIWVFLPDDNEGWRPYTFDGELAALEAKYAIPDEENATLIYDELFKTIDGDPNEPEFFLSSRPSSKDKPWRTADHPETAEWLKGKQGIIEELLRATKKEKCHFSIPVYSWDLDVERFSKMRRCTWLLLSAANNDIAEGRIDAGLEKYLCIVRLAEHLYQQPVMIDFLVAFAIERSALEQFNRFMIENKPNEEQLELIGNTIKSLKNNWNSDCPKIIDIEKLQTKNLLCSFAYQINPQGKVRLSRDPLAVTRERVEEELKGGEIQDPEHEAALQKLLHSTYWQKKRWKAGVILAYLGMPSTPKEVSKNIDSGFQRLYAMAEPDFDWAGSPKELSFNPMKVKFNWVYVTRSIADMMASMLEQSYYSLHDLYLRNIAEQRGTRIIIALRRCKNKTGHWPESLDELKSLVPTEIFIDPINGDSFVYKLTEENFTLYSKGKNNIDEDGQYNSNRQQEPKPDDWLIWPPRIRINKPENTNDK